MAETRAKANPPLTHTDSLVGRTIGRYRVREFLGAGAMGEVYLADDPVLKREVAVKRIAPSLREDKEYRARFLREAERASRVKSPHVALIYDVIETGNEIFLVMEQVKGHLLRKRLHGPVTVESFLKVAEQCAEALEGAHREGIVHCDIKPENIMVTDDDEVKLLDFGVAKRLPRSAESTTMDRGQSGTPAYMAPEVLLNRPVDGRTDLFSLGIVFYEMLTKQHPFAAKSFAETMNAILDAKPRPPRELNNTVPTRVEAIVMRMLAKEPADRYANASDLLAALRHAHSLYPDREIPETRRKRSRSQVGWLVLLALAVLTALSAGVLHWRKRDRVVLVKGPKQLAVLPFSSSDNPDTRAFSNGLTETLTTKLTQLREDYGLLVIPSSEVRSESVRSADQARRLFGATVVLEGSLEQSAGRVRIDYMLVDARSLQPLHAEVITESANNPFAVEDKVVASVLKALDVELRGQDWGVTTIRNTTTPKAYDYYLRGLGYLRESQKPENTQAAIAVFQNALEQDAHYALAWAGLGQAYWQEYENTRERKWVGKASASCKRAESLDKTLAAVHLCLGMVLKGTGENDLAVQELERATEIDPTSDDAVRELAEALQQQGKARDAEAAYRRSIEIRPQAWLAYDRLGIFYSNQGRYAEAATAFEQVIQLAPDGYQGYNNLGGIYLAQGKYDRAVPLLMRSATVLPTSTAYSNLGAAYVYMKRFDDAVGAYQKAVSEPEAGFDEWGNLAEAYYYGLRDQQRAIETYKKAIALANEQLKVNARDPQLLSSLGLYKALTKERDSALYYSRQALAVASSNNEVLFNVAKTETILGDNEQALNYLAKAIANGYSKYYAKDDPVFGDLRLDPRFSRLVGEP